MDKPGHKMQCPECKEVLQSMHRHDLVQCHCPNKCFVDGGSAYMRCGFMYAPPITYKDPNESPRTL